MVLYWSNYIAQYFAATIPNIVISLLFLFFAYKVDTVNDIGLYSAKGGEEPAFSAPHNQFMDFLSHFYVACLGGSHNLFKKNSKESR